MKNIIDLLEKHTINQPKKADKNWLTILLVTGAIILFSSIVINITTTKIVPAQENTWNSATPGYDFSQSIQEKLGEPVEIKETELGKEYNYKSEFPTRNSTILVSDDNVVLFMQERIPYNPEHTLNSYVAEFGEPQLVLNYPQISNAVKAHVFLDKGLVIFAHDADQSVEAIWYFEPTTKDKFLESWGKDLTTKKKGPERF